MIPARLAQPREALGLAGIIQCRTVRKRPGTVSGMGGPSLDSELRAGFAFFIVAFALFVLAVVS